MQEQVSNVTAAGTVYEIGGQCLGVDAPGFGDLVAQAYADHRRLRCLCRGPGVEMYVARRGGPRQGFIIKRMPDTGWQHLPQCPSYAPPATLSGLGQVLGSAIVEDPVTGATTLRLGFALTKIAGRAVMASPGEAGGSVGTDGAKLSLRGLLHYLWDEAELTRWHPGFSGKRSWGTVRRQLLRAAESMSARRDPLRARLYLPEPFSLDQREAINARRLAAWSSAVAQPGGPMPLMLLIAQVKEIVPARYGFKAVIKHLPDQAFAIDEVLYRRLGRCFESELTLWAAAEDVLMVIIATFGLGSHGTATIQELSLMPVTRQWLPVDDGLGKQLVDRLVAEGRDFARSLRYELPARAPVAFAVLLDSADSPTSLHVLRGDSVEGIDPDAAADPGARWVWHSHLEPLPALPPRGEAAGSRAAEGQRSRRDTEKSGVAEAGADFGEPASARSRSQPAQAALAIDGESRP